MHSRPSTDLSCTKIRYNFSGASIKHLQLEVSLLKIWWDKILIIIESWLSFSACVATVEYFICHLNTYQVLYCQPTDVPLLDTGLLSKWRRSAQDQSVWGNSWQVPHCCGRLLVIWWRWWWRNLMLVGFKQNKQCESHTQQPWPYFIWAVLSNTR